VHEKTEGRLGAIAHPNQIDECLIRNISVIGCAGEALNP
jgi:hypothetical protein